MVRKDNSQKNKAEGVTRRRLPSTSRDTDPGGLQEKRASVLGIPKHRVIVKVRYDLKHTRGSEDEFYYMYNLSVGELAVVFAERRLGWRLGVPLMAGVAAEEPKK